jgi:hypothetical protein
MSFETFVELLCLIPAVLYLIIYEINWEVVKKWIFS